MSYADVVAVFDSSDYHAVGEPHKLAQEWLDMLDTESTEETEEK